MASDPSEPFALSIRGVTDLIQNRTNKMDGSSSENPEGIEGEKYDSFELKMTDSELLQLRDTWERRYAPYEARILPKVKKNKESYLGTRPDGQWLVSEIPIAANLQFEAEETFLAAALAKNPEPVVYADNTPEGNALSNDVKTMLQFHADSLIVRRKLSLAVRQWSIFYLGVLKVGWDEKIEDITVKNARIQDFVFDPNGHVDAYGDFSSYLGERKTVTAEKLVELFPDHKEAITVAVDGFMGTEVTYTEWWTDTFTFTTFRDIVLSKEKNIYFRYPEPIRDANGTEMVDPFTEEKMTETKRNHFAAPKKPYIFLSVFSLQEQPHDITSLIEQNIPTQNLIAKRTDQIDVNISKNNNSHAFSEDNFNQETAKQAATAMRKGNPILIPSGGQADRAIIPLPAQGLPNDVFVELETNKNNLRSSWGIQGIAAQDPDEDQTARGMILNQSHDTTRIGGGIGDAVEQVADNLFNWFVQLYYVFYDEEHFAAIMGSAKAVEFVTLSNEKMNKQLIVSVSPNSMKPKDEVTNMNLAQALYDKGAIGPKTLLKMVDFPNPDEAAADGALWMADKLAYIRINFPEMFASLQGAQVEMAGQMLPGAGGTPAPGGAPEGVTEPPPELSMDAASAALSQVPISGAPPTI